MIIAFDIGNTAISLALLKGKRVLHVDTIDINVKRDELYRQIDSYIKHHLSDLYRVDRGIICSVVPKKTRAIQRYVAKKLQVPVSVIGQDVNVPIVNNYTDKKQVGQDRLVGAYAVKKMFGSPAIIVDFGTATTFDLVNDKGEYDGGIIVPGVRLSAESLFSKTALLPRIEHINAPKHLIGRNTQESILSGIFYGYGAMCTGLIDEIQHQTQRKPKIILTGGYTQVMKRFIKAKISKIDRHLVFKGIAFLHQDCPPDL